MAPIHPHRAGFLLLAFNLLARTIHLFRQLLLRLIEKPKVIFTMGLGFLQEGLPYIKVPHYLKSHPDWSVIKINFVFLKAFV